MLRCNMLKSESGIQMIKALKKTVKVAPATPTTEQVVVAPAAEQVVVAAEPMHPVLAIASQTPTVKAGKKLSANAVASRAVNAGKGYPLTATITVVNSAKFNRDSRQARYGLHEAGQTVGAYLTLAKDRFGWSHADSQADLRWEVAKGYIVIE